MSSSIGVAKSQKSKTTEERIEKAFEDLEEATKLAFDAQIFQFSQGSIEAFDKPDLQALAKLIELAFKANGVLSADGKKVNGADAPVAVPLDELERLVKAAKTKGKDDKED